ncbi:MAG: hypothetical protein ACXVQ5_08065, partial [Actinomycetota bacterium]
MKVCIFVANPCIADSRVLRQADTFARAGYETVIVAVKRSREPFVERRDGFEIRRVLATRGGARALSVSRHRMKAAASAVRASDLDDLQLPNAMPSDE